VLNDFEKSIRKEHILASEDFLEWPSEPKLAEALIISVPKLHVIGQIAASTSETHFLARSLLSL
jgi:hypothetical protein